MRERLFRIERTTMETVPYHLVLGWRNENQQTYDEIGYYLSEKEFTNLKQAVEAACSRPE
jgi:hypothetical protein